MTKRTFFKSLMGAVAAVALAPEIAFGVRLKMPEVQVAAWVVTMKWKNLNQMEHTLTHPCTQAERDRFFIHTIDLMRLDPPCEATFKVLPHGKVRDMRTFQIVP